YGLRRSEGRALGPPREVLQLPPYVAGGEGLSIAQAPWGTPWGVLAMFILYTTRGVGTMPSDKALEEKLARELAKADIQHRRRELAKIDRQIANLKKARDRLRAEIATLLP